MLRLAVIGAENRDAFVSRLNSGAAFAYDLRFLNIRFAKYEFDVMEDAGYLSVPVSRCYNNSACFHGNHSIDEIPFNYVIGDGVDSGLPVPRVKPKAYSYADGVCTARGSGCASTAWGRQDCYPGSENRNDCE